MLFSSPCRVLIRQVQTRHLTDDPVQFFSELDPLSLVLPYLAFQMMPLTLSLLQFFFDRLFFGFNPFVGFEEAVDRRFKLFNIVESHRDVYHKTSCWSLVLTSSLVKPMARSPRETIIAVIETIAKRAELFAIRKKLGVPTARVRRAQPSAPIVARGYLQVRPSDRARARCSQTAFASVYQRRL
jgi:hypothetical protein